MKNVHLLPTDNKPSRLYFNVNDKEFQICEIEKPSTILKPNRHIYITNDEEIKLNDYVIQVNFEKTNIQVIQCVTEFQVKIANNKDGSFTKNKIILTTDQDLIKDGVQAINDEFLEWFVKNPSCEEVNVNKSYGGTYYITYPYKIIIPKEEPKQETTLEEAAENHLQKWRLLNNIHLSNVLHAERCKNDFTAGAKWQQERMYSEEEVLEILLKHQSDYRSAVRNTSPLNWSFDINKWFEQFKKK